MKLLISADILPILKPEPDPKIPARLTTLFWTIANYKTEDESFKSFAILIIKVSKGAETTLI